MSIEKKLLGTNPVAGGDDPEGVSFDGTNDYLSRSSDLTGNADGKTFTFSCWVYFPPLGEMIYHVDDGAGSTLFMVKRNSGGDLRVTAPGSTFNGEISGIIKSFGWYHILISLDLTNTSNRYIYVNDVLQSPTWGYYANSNINFTSDYISVLAHTYSGAVQELSEGRAAHVFLDYTYRDLSVEANRRLFIDSDGKPSDTIPSSPIIYLPMTDAATAGSNSGTGGDFTVNGVLDTAQRGPNQDNCSASEFDHANDYLSRSSISGLSNGKIFTFCCNFKLDGVDAEPFLEFGTTGLDTRFRMTHQSSTTPYIYLRAHNSSGTQILSYQVAADGFKLGTHHSLQASIDLSDTSKRSVYLDGIAQTNTYAIYTNDTIEFNSGVYRVGRDTYGNNYFEGSIGELYFDTVYTDLATDNPFWDADANRPKPVRQVIDETGTTPLIALPLRGDDAGNNLGTGGDFTVQSGPFTGARGGSEFWARGAQMLGSNSGNYLNNNSISGLSSVKTFTLMAAVKSLGSSDKQEFFHLYNSSNQDVMKFTYDVGNNSFYVNAYDSSRNLLLSSSAVSLTYNVYNIFLISVNLASSADAYINGTAGGSLTIESNANIAFSSVTKCYINAEYSGGDNRPSQAASLYFSTSYIDFTQEANRNLFVDQLGYPKDLTPAIEAGDITEPLIYMKFDDTSALGTNSGTGGNFTVNGTVTAGPDVDPNA